jgi:hypothetical protein
MTPLPPFIQRMNEEKIKPEEYKSRLEYFVKMLEQVYNIEIIKKDANPP